MRWGAINYLLLLLFSTAFWNLANSRPVHSLVLPSYLFFCMPCLLPPFAVPCMIVLARPDEQETCSYHCSLHLFTMIKRSSCGPIVCWILAWTSSLVTWSLLRCIVSCGSISFPCLYSCLQLCCEGPWLTSILGNGCDKGVHKSHPRTEGNAPVIPNWFQHCWYCCCLC